VKTVVLITPSAVHRRLYGTGLARRFRVELSSAELGAAAPVSALIYDVPDLHTSFDFRFVKRVDCPVVLLTPETDLRPPPDGRLRVLSYPVTIDQILVALQELGVEP